MARRGSQLFSKWFRHAWDHVGPHERKNCGRWAGIRPIRKREGRCSELRHDAGRASVEDSSASRSGESGGSARNSRARAPRKGRPHSCGDRQRILTEDSFRHPKAVQILQHDKRSTRWHSVRTGAGSRLLATTPFRSGLLLRVRPSELVQLTWEFLFDPGLASKDYLAQTAANSPARIRHRYAGTYRLLRRDGRGSGMRR